MVVDYYRRIDLINEHVIAKSESISTPTDFAKGNITKNSSREFSVSKYIGPTRIVDGVSVRCPTFLLKFFNNTNRQIFQRLDNFSERMEKASNNYYKTERKVTTRISNLHSDPSENLVHGFSYTALATMSGAILARKRNFAVRYTLPVILGSFGFWYSLPVTFSNTMNLVHDIESSLFPKFVERQDVVFEKGSIAVDHTIMTYYIIKDKLHSLQEFIEGHLNFV